MRKEYFLSFCIPVYNHADFTYQIVTNILKSQDERIQVVVADDASTDDTLRQLATIKDERLKIVTAAENRGPQLNWYHSLMQGDGKWLYLVIGRDLINMAKLPALMDILGKALEKKNVGFVRETAINERIKIYQQKDALKYLLDFGHPTGNIFLRSAFREAPEKEEYYFKADVFPENYVKRDISRKYACAEIRRICYTGRHVVPLRAVRSKYEKKSPYPFYHPKRSIGQFIEIVDMIEECGNDLSKKDYDELYLHKFRFLLNVVTFIQRRRFLNADFLGHYGEKKKTVGKPEMLKNMVYAYREVCKYYRKMNLYRRLGMIKIMFEWTKKVLLYKE